MPRETQRINVAAALIIGADFVMMLTALMLVLPPTSYIRPTSISSRSMSTDAIRWRTGA